MADDFADVLQEFVAHGTVGFQGKRSERASFSVRKGIILIVLRLFCMFQKQTRRVAVAKVGWGVWLSDCDVRLVGALVEILESIGSRACESRVVVLRDCDDAN